MLHQHGCCWVQQQGWLPVLLLAQPEQPLLLLLLGQEPPLLRAPSLLLLLLQQVRLHRWEGLLLGCCCWRR